MKKGGELTYNSISGSQSLGKTSIQFLGKEETKISKFQDGGLYDWDDLLKYLITFAFTTKFPVINGIVGTWEPEKC